MTKEHKDFVNNLEVLNLNPECHYSHITNQFYWTSKLEIREGSLLVCICEHRDTPEEALDEYIKRLKGKQAVAYFAGKRKEYVFI